MRILRFTIRLVLSTVSPIKVVVTNANRVEFYGWYKWTPMTYNFLLFRVHVNFEGMDTTSMASDCKFTKYFKKRTRNQESCIRQYCLCIERLIKVDDTLKRKLSCMHMSYQCILWSYHFSPNKSCEWGETCRNRVRDDLLKWQSYVD